ncbi:5086_t:CDS:2, partial [Funneliformis geosporum]
MSCLSRIPQAVLPITNRIEQVFKPTISQALRETLFTQGQTRSLSESDFEFYKKKLSYHYKRDET